MSDWPAGIVLILDQGIPRDSVSVLRKAGVLCDHVGELGLSRAEDTAIIDLARERNAVIVTLDADFHAILATSAAAGPSVVHIRMQGLNGAQIAKLMLEIVRHFAADLQRGCLITVKRRKTTCHMLPITRSE